MNRVLIVPACQKGGGGGHLYRSAALASSVRAGGGRAWLCGAGDVTFPGIPPDLFMDEETALAKDWPLVVLDKFRTAPEEVRRWSACAPVAAVDEGRSRSACDFLVDLLPGVSGEAPNLCAPALLPLPRRRRPGFYRGPGTASILLCFGAEDAAGLTVPAALALQNARSGAFSLTAVLGPLYRDPAKDGAVLEKAGVTVLSAPKLGEILADYDLFITHFGVAAFEALHARVPVLLVNPGPYHEGLARRAGFVSAGAGKKRAARLGRFTGIFRGPEVFFHRVERYARRSEAAFRRWNLEEQGDLAALLRSSLPRVYRACPLCGLPPDFKKAALRFPGRTYRRCSCGTFYMSRLDPPPVSYNREYFFEHYRKQYGKTYLEDFPSLKKAGERRLERIRALLEKTQAALSTPPRLLDIGCAYGPFLAAAQERGFDVLGQDPAEDAAAFVREKLGIRALTGSFPADIEQITGVLEPGETFAALTLWYVVEHFTDPGKALEAANGLLKKGGVLAFSTPSAAGVSRRKSLRSFLEQSPADHWTIWDPRRCGRILRRYGFRLKKRVITGHHPERFPLVGPFLKPLPGMVYRICTLISRIFGLGDTFEAYAVKTAEGRHG